MKHLDDFLFTSSTVEDGNMSVDWSPEAEVIMNRRKFLEKNHLKLEDCVFMDLQHGADIAVVGDGDQGGSIKVDALMTDAPCLPAVPAHAGQAGVVLFLMTADCFPLAYHDPVKNVAALAHLGWKSTDLGLAGKVVELMTKRFGSDPKDVVAFFGPGIHRESYLVQSPTQKDDRRWTPFLEDALGRSPATGEALGFTKVDLVGFNQSALMDVGIQEGNISISSENTAVSPRYFSHRRSMQTGEPEGRFATIVTIR